MSDSKASKAQNLARIRDNQRRSRARRKEYLQELETKLRHFEQRGIEASAEIQSAARRVLEENRKLRALLHERGVSEAEIVMAMDGSNDSPYDQTLAAPALITMLDRRIAYSAPSCTSSTSSPPPTDLSVSLESHPPAVPPISIPIQRTVAMSSSNDSPSPHSMGSSIDTPPHFHGTPFYSVPMTPAPEIKTEDLSPYVSYDQSFNNPWNYSNNVQYIPDYTTSSSIDAANIIRTMRSGVGPELEGDLGCRMPDQQCYVNNNVVFNVMNRYANQTGV